jgi:uncharacterized membrane protein
MNTIGVVHTALASVALLAGLAIFSIAKGTRLHRAVGYVYVLCMLGLNLTALTIYRLFDGFGPFHYFAIASLITVMAGFLHVFTRRPRETWLYHHYAWILWSYVGLVAAAVSEVLTRAPLIDASGARFAAAVFIGSAVTLAIGGAIIHRKRDRVVAKVQSMWGADAL